MSDTTVPEATETATPVEPKKSKLDLKRQQILVDRVRRFMNQGMSQQEAIARVQREDYERLPVDKKLVLLQAGFANNLDAICDDVKALRANETDLADAMDVNFRAIYGLLVELGIPADKIKAALKASEEQFEEDKRADAAAAEAKKAVATEDGKKQELADTIDKAGTPGIPEGATVFGG